MILYLSRMLRFFLKPISLLAYNRRLPHFHKDFSGKKVLMISELPGGESHWLGMRRKKADLGNTHPWNRYFNRPLQTAPETLADIESFLYSCEYVSDRKTRSQEDFWEPPDVFEERKTGDCEDHAIWAWRHLHDAGYKTRFVLGEAGGWHAWVHIFVNGRAYLLEATQKTGGFPDSSEYDAHWSVERMEKKKFAFYLHGEDDDTVTSMKPEHEG